MGVNIIQQFISIFLLNLLTSIDNAIVLGGVVNRYKKKQNLLIVGLVSSLVITICRTILIAGIVSVSNFPGLRFSLGVAVLVVAINLANISQQNQRDPSSLWRLMLMVIVTDLALSVDVVLSIALLSKNLLMIALSVFLSLLPLLMLLPVIIRVMVQVAWLRILAAGFVAELAIDSITDDPWIQHFVPTGRFEFLLRASFAAVVIAYGFWRTYVWSRET